MTAAKRTDRRVKVILPIWMLLGWSLRVCRICRLLWRLRRRCVDDGYCFWGSKDTSYTSIHLAQAPFSSHVVPIVYRFIRVYVCSVSAVRPILSITIGNAWSDQPYSWGWRKTVHITSLKNPFPRPNREILRLKSWPWWGSPDFMPEYMIKSCKWNFFLVDGVVSTLLFTTHETWLTFNSCWLIGKSRDVEMTICVGHFTNQPSGH